MFREFNPDVNVLFEYTEKALAKRIERIFRKYSEGKKVGVCVLRHAYISHFLDGAPGLRECTALAKKMGHSATLQQYYRRLDKKDASSTEEDTESDEE